MNGPQVSVVSPRGTVTKFYTPQEAEEFLDLLATTGSRTERDEVNNGLWAIDVPEEMNGGVEINNIYSPS